MSKYLLDSNVLIQAHRMHYPFDVVPGFWNKIIELSNKDIIMSIDKVKKEICDTGKPDNLSNWCQNALNDGFFIDTSPCIDVYAKIATWAQGNTQFTQNAKDGFLATDLADPWLIAHAAENNLVIVTHEISQPQIKNRIKIPEACVPFGVRFISPIEMFRALGERF